MLGKETILNYDSKYEASPSEAWDQHCLKYFNAIGAEKALVWFIGIRLYTLLFKKKPFEGSSSISGELDLSGCSCAELQDFLTKCLNKDPVKRLSLDEVIRFFEILISSDEVFY